MGRAGWLGIFLIFSLAGCATTPLQVVMPALNQNIQDRFELDGRLGVRYRDESSSGGIHWQHRPEIDNLTLSSPLGQTLTVLNRDANGVTLIDSGHQTHHAQNVADLTAQLLGWPLPLQNLAYWVVGRTAPDQPYQIQQDTEHGLINLTQSGWLVTYSRWEQVEGVTLPNKLSFSGHGVEVRLVISDWKRVKVE